MLNPDLVYGNEFLRVLGAKIVSVKTKTVEVRILYAI